MCRKIRAAGLFGLALCQVFVCVESHAVGVLFRPLGDLPGGAFGSQAIDVSADGATVVGRADIDFFAGVSESFIWTLADGMRAVPGPPDATTPPSSNANAVSNAGLVVGAARVDPGSGALQQGYLWDADDNPPIATAIDSLTPGDFSSELLDIQTSGGIAVGFSDTASGDMAYFVAVNQGVPATPVPIQSGPWTDTRARAVADGAVIVGSGVNGAGPFAEPFRWTPGEGMQPIGIFDGDLEGTAFGVSDDGLTIVGTSNGDNQSRAFRWTSTSQLQDLGGLPDGGDFYTAFDASADGSLIVGQGSDASNAAEAFIWDAGDGMRSLKEVLESEHGLDLTGWSLDRAASVSADGSVIVGRGTNPSGDREAWLVDLSFESPAGPGDLNGDGVLDIDDYADWKANFGTAGTAFFTSAGNGDSVLDAADYTLWRDGFVSEGAGSGAAAVPEPSAIVLVLIAGISRRRS